VPTVFNSKVAVTDAHQPDLKQGILNLILRPDETYQIEATIDLSIRRRAEQRTRRNLASNSGLFRAQRRSP